jgi:hypothetical protein
LGNDEKNQILTADNLAKRVGQPHIQIVGVKEDDRVQYFTWWIAI